MELSEQEFQRVLRIFIQLVREPVEERIAFNLTEAAKITGISERQLGLAVARRELKARRIGKSYRISRRALIDWIDGW